MEKKIYSLRYLPIFEQDLTNAINYIANTLQNQEAAAKLLDDIEVASSNACMPRSPLSLFRQAKNASINIFAFMYTVLLFIMW